MKNQPKFVRAKPNTKKILLGRLLRMMQIGSKSQTLNTKQRKLETNVDDGVEISFDTYPIPKDWSILFHLTSTLYQDFFEVAYNIPKQ